MVLTTWLSTILLQLSLLASLHPIHVSVTEIEYDEKEQALEIMMRVFIDDLELTLRNEVQDDELDILHPKGGKTTDEIAGGYVTEHFRISLDGRPQRLRFLGHEREAEALIFFIEVSGVPRWKTINIHNDIIMSTYDDQSNIVHVFVGEDVKSLRLTPGQPAAQLAFGK